MESLAAKAPLSIKLVLPVIVILFAVAVGLPKGAGFWAAWYLMKAVLSLAAFVALSALGFLACVTARARFEKILENNKKWEALQAHSGTAVEAMGRTVAALSSPPLAGLVFTGTLPNLRMSPTDLLFTNHGIPFEVSKELGML